MEYILLLIVVFILLIISVIKLIKFSHKIISKYINNKVISWILSLIPLSLFIIGLFIDATNTIVVYIHIILITYIVKIINLISKKILKKSFNESTIIIIVFLLTTIIMCHGYYLAHHVIETNYQIATTKEIGTDTFRIVQTSDSHIGNTMDGKKFTKYMEKINKLKPDIVVLTGDFIDDNTSYNDMIEATKGLGLLKTKYGVFFAYGNHDRHYFSNQNYNEKDLINELEKNNVKILLDDYVTIADNFIIVGRQDASFKRTDIKELTKDLDKNKYIIVLDHQPNDYDNESKANVDLVLSGHTHGGQLFPLGKIGLLLGVNDRIYGIEKRNNTTFIVNSGISDWTIKFKTGTISEYVVIDIIKK